MSRALVLWSDYQAANFGVRVLAEGVSALLAEVSPGISVDVQGYGAGVAPFPVGRLKGTLKRAVTMRREVQDWVRSYDIVVDIRAGDSFTDIYGLKNLAEQSAFSDLAVQAGRRPIFGPITVGPFTSKRGRMIARASLARAGAIAVRDSYSGSYVEGMGFTPDAVGTDVVFALPQPDEVKRREGHVLVNASGMLWNTDVHGPREHYRRAMKDIIEGLLAEGRPVTLVSHDIPDAPVSDEHACRALLREFDGRVDYLHPRTLTDVRRWAAGADLVIGARMHMCLNALSVGTPAIPMAYSRKFDPLMKDVGWANTVEIRDESVAQRVLDRVNSAASEPVAPVLERAHSLLVPVRNLYAHQLDLARA